MIRGRVWRFGDGIDTDVLAPGVHMKKPIDQLAKHCLEAIDPDFAKTVQPGDVVVADRNFGLGSSREQAAQALAVLGVGAVVARSFARIFYRNALNLGLPALFSDDVERIRPGDRLAVDPVAGTMLNETTGESLACRPIPAHLMAMVSAGGLMPYLKRRFAKEPA